MNSTVSKLENCKSMLRKTYKDFYSNQYLEDFNIHLSDEEYREARIMILKMCNELGMDIPHIINVCRSVEEFIYFISTDDGSHFGENMGYISNQFNSLIDFAEMENIEVQIINVKSDFPEELNYHHILEDVEKCEQRIDSGDYSGALTSAKSLIEGVLKEIILNIEGREIESKLSLTELFKEVRSSLNLDPGNRELQKPLREVVSGLIKVVHGLNEVRNISGDAHTRKITPSLHHAVLVVNSAKTVANFLFHTYQYQRDSGKIKIPN